MAGAPKEKGAFVAVGVAGEVNENGLEGAGAACGGFGAPKVNVLEAGAADA